MSEKEGVMLPALSGASAPVDPLNGTTLPGVRRSNRSSSCSSGSADQVRRLQRENARLKEEMESLKAMFARRIGHDAVKFEEKILAKDADCEAWFKQKKQDLKAMQAASTIMKSIFDVRRKKHMDIMTAERESFAKQKAQCDQDMAHMKVCLKEQEDENKKVLDYWTKEWEMKQLKMEQEKESLQSENKKLQKNLNEKNEECDRLRKEQLEQSQALEQLRNRLLHVERADELLKRNSQIEALEAELKRTKKMIHERQQGEADSLRRELMEYVKFIVQILPEEWQNKVKEQEGLRFMPAEAKNAVLAPAPPGTRSTDSRGRNPRSKDKFKHRASHAVYPSPYLQNGTLGGFMDPG